MKRFSSRHGFTLVELMIVVTIIGMMAAAVAPALATALADGRASSAAVDLVRLGVRARAETTSTGLAHLLAFSQDPGSGLGRVELLRGIRNKCGMQEVVWDGTNSILIDRVAMTDYNIGASHRVDLRTLPNDLQIIQICYQPDGSMRTRNAAGGAFGFGDVEFTVTRSLNNVQQGAQRLVLFTSGGTARLVR
jgi:prepilin-type N-terminal cleavage/methylation domain-containing protein